MATVFGMIVGLGILVTLLVTALILLTGLLGLRVLSFGLSVCLGHRRTAMLPGFLRRTRQAGIAVVVLVAVTVSLSLVAKTEQQGVSRWRDLQQQIRQFEAASDRFSAVAEQSGSFNEIRLTSDELALSATVPTGAAAPTAQDNGSGAEATQQRQNETVADETSEPATSENTASGSASPSIPAMIEERRKKLAEFAGQIGQLVRAQLESPASVGALNGSTGESSNGDVVVFQLSEEMLRQMLGDSATEMLQTFNAQMPGGIRQTYALIPLSSPVGATVPQVQPLLAASGLSSLADSLVSILNLGESAPKNNASVVSTDETTAVRAAETQEQPAVQEIPEWIGAPSSNQRVAETEALFGDSDDQTALDQAVSRTVLASILQSETADVQQLRVRADSVSLQLSSQIVQRCIVNRFTRTETLETGAEGRKSFRVLYALVDVPEDIRQKIIRGITGDLQKTRAVELGTSVAGIWLAATLLATGLRCWQSGTRLRRWLSVPLFGLSLPLSVAGVLSLSILLNGPLVRPASGMVQWEHAPSRIVISE